VKAFGKRVAGGAASDAAQDARSVCAAAGHDDRRGGRRPGAGLLGLAVV
jgi:hypothetical protein